MVDTLYLNDEHRTVSGFTIPPENIFCVDGKFTEPGIIENIAQTAALRTGYMVWLDASASVGTEPPIGYIGAIKKLKIFRLPRAGQELRTEIEITQMIFDVTVITGSSYVDGEPVATCEMKIFLKKD